MYKPRILDLLKSGYSRQTFLKDLTAGVIVGIVAIPLAVAFAIASGVKPDVGLLTAVIGGFLISALGGSSVQIGGPTGAFIVIIYGILSKFGPDGLILATLMAGLMLLVLGFSRLGNVIQYIPYPVIVGFTSGIAVIILSTQINDFLGLGLRNIPTDFLEKWHLYLTNLDKTNFPALGLSLFTIIAIILLGRISKKVPGALLALIASTIIVWLLNTPLGWNIETIGSRFGTISGSFPLPQLPQISLDRLKELLLPAFSIAMLAGIESLLSAVVADGMIGKKHDSNAELVGQGFANITSGLFGGLPVTGAIARTATNVRSGAQTPVAGIIHALVLLGVLLFLSPLAGLIPLASLAGILATVAYNMSEHNTFRMLLKGPRGDILTLLVTFFLTVLVDLTIAIPVGILLALLSFLQKMSQTSQVTIYRDVFQDVSPETDPFGLTSVPIPQNVEILEIDSPLFFGAAESLKEELNKQAITPSVLILRLRNVPSADSSGIMVLRDLLKKTKKHKTHLLFAAVQPQVKAVFDKIGLTKEMGEENILPNVVLALDRCKALLGVKETSLATKIRNGGPVLALSAPDPFSVIMRSVPHLSSSEQTQKVLMKSIWEREELASTALGKGLSFPHPHNPIIVNEQEESITFVYLNPPIDWSAEDGIPVHTAIFILSQSVQSHLKTLSQLTKFAGNQEFLNLLQAKVETEVLIEWIEGHLIAETPKLQKLDIKVSH